MLDLGLNGRKAIVCGSSRGLGRACAESLARVGLCMRLGDESFKSILPTTKR